MPDSFSDRKIVREAVGWLKKNDSPAFKARVKRMSNINAKDSDQWTVLTHAAALGNPEPMKWLLDRGARLDTADDYDVFDTPLSIAAKNGCFEAVKLLVFRGARVDLHVGNWQCTAECGARINGHHAISEFLLYHEKRR